VESYEHDTTPDGICQRCGKVRREVWESHRYGLQALKPALEPIIVFQKPYAGKPAACIAETGAGALWIDGGRIGRASDDTSGWSVSGSAASENRAMSGANYAREPKPDAAGRWPANFVLCHTPDCRRVGERRVRAEQHSGKPGNGKNEFFGPSLVFTGQTRCYADADGLETVAAWDCVPECPVRRLGEQSGTLQSGNLSPRHNVQATSGWSGGSQADRVKHEFESSTGTASRFFFNADWSLDVAEQLAAADSVRYQAKASRRERDAGLEGMPLQQKRILNGGITSADHPETAMGGGDRTARNPHPTVKPIALARWLATLLLPPAAYAPRRVLVPFAGSGSEMIGAALAGWEYVLGIDAEAEYCAIARARLAHWCTQPALPEACDA
jgi:hypothetical protein